MDIRHIHFTFEEIVEVYEPRLSTRLNGMVDCAQTTKGYAEVNDKEVVNLIIDKCEVFMGDRILINTDIQKNKDGYVKILNGVLL